MKSLLTPLPKATKIGHIFYFCPAKAENQIKASSQLFKNGCQEFNPVIIGMKKVDILKAIKE